jgi:hypothetical protein
VSTSGVITSNGQTTPYVTETQNGVTCTQTDGPDGGQTCVTQQFQGHAPHELLLSHLVRTPNVLDPLRGRSIHLGATHDKRHYL